MNIQPKKSQSNKENKYIEYSDDIFDKYLKIVGDINE